MKTLFDNLGSLNFCTHRDAEMLGNIFEVFLGYGWGEILSLEIPSLRVESHRARSSVAALCICATISEIQKNKIFMTFRMYSQGY